MKEILSRTLLLLMMALALASCGEADPYEPHDYPDTPSYIPDIPVVPTDIPLPPPDVQLCIPGEMACDGNVIQQCHQSGTSWIWYAPCGSGLVCFEGECIPGDTPDGGPSDGPVREDIPLAQEDLSLPQEDTSGVEPDMAAEDLIQTDPEICGDGLDNDGDGLTDCADPECTGPECLEICDDGVDNDADGLVDCHDQECTSLCTLGGNDSCEGPLAVTASRSIGGNTSGFFDNYVGSCGGEGADAVLAVELAADQAVTVDMFGSSFDSVLHVRTTCDDPATEMACSNTSTLEPGSAFLDLGVLGAGTYYVIFDGLEDDDEGPMNINVVISPP